MRSVKEGKKWGILTFILLVLMNTNTAFAQSWSPIGPGGGGWITALTVVNDNAHTTYVGCDVGGIYKSTDNGQTWTIKDNGLPMYFMHDIAYDKNNPNTLYLACRAGVFKSTDGGELWVAKRDHFPPYAEFEHSAPISDIAIAPTNQNIIFAGVGVPNTGYDLDAFQWQTAQTKGTIFKSTDGADTWTVIHDTGIPVDAMIYSLTVHPTNADIVYAATSNGVYKSVDGGANWVLKNTGIPHGLTMKIVISPTSPNTLYVSIWAEPGSATWQGGIYKTTDGGENWVAKNTGLPQVVDPERGLTTNYPTLVIDENNPDILYTGNMAWTPDPGVFKTVDGGEHWTLTTRPDPPNPNVDMGWNNNGVSASVIAIDPNNSSSLYLGTSMHVYKTDDAGDNWAQVITNDMGNGYWQGNGLETTVVEAIAIDPNDPNKLYAGYWDIGFLKSIDGGQSFKKVDTGFGEYKSNCFDIVIDPDNSAILYAANGWWETKKGAVYKSTDFGESWTVINNGLPDTIIWSIAVDKNSPANSRTLYAACYDKGIYKSTDGGQNWSPFNTGLGVDGNLKVKKIVIDPNDSGILYAGIETQTIEEGNNLQTVQGGIFKYTTADTKWTRIGSDQITVWDIDISPTNSQVIYTCVKSEYDHSLQTSYAGGVYKSTDGGVTWTMMDSGFGPTDNLNVSDLTIDPTNTNTLYAVTTDDAYHDLAGGRGIFKSTDGAQTWTSFNEGLGVHYFETIVLSPNADKIFAGSGGNGVVVRNLTPLALEWSYFTAQKQVNDALLTWATTTEENVSHFEILRRFEGKNWQNIGRVDAAGYSTQSQRYQFIDKNVPDNDDFSATAYYQLKAIDFDGKQTWNDIHSLYWPEAATNIFVYPNPARNVVNIQNLQGHEIKRISIFDPSGKMVLFSKKSNQLDISGLKPGVYEVQIDTRFQVFRASLVVE